MSTAKTLLAILLTIWMLVISGLWSKQSLALLESEREPSFSLPPVIEGTILTLQYIKIALNYLLIIAIPASPSLLLAYLVFSLRRAELPVYIEAPLWVIAVGSLILCVILQFYWTSYAFSHNSFMMSREELYLSFHAAMVVWTKIWLYLVTALPVLLALSLGVITLIKMRLI